VNAENLEADPEPPEPQESGVWHRMEIDDCGDYILVSESTNDNLDTGYPSQCSSWANQYPNIEAALKHTGKSRIGCSGIRVEVFLNGEQI
jgi:hypothetical protein